MTSCPASESLRSSAHAVSSWREESCSLRSTAETWVSTVLIEMKSARRHLLVGVAAGDQAHDLLLARGQAVELVAPRPARRDRAEGVEHEAGEAR